MKNTASILAVILLCAFLFSAPVYPAEAPVRPLEVGDAFPRFTASDIYGKQVDTGKLKGKVIILSIGYFDQSRKRNEEDSAEGKRLDDFYGANRGKGLEVIRISSKRGVPFFITKSFVESRSRESCEKDKDPWTVIIDWDNSLRKLLKITKGPLTFIIDKSGIIKYKKNGYLTVDREVEGLVKKELGN